MFHSFRKTTLAKRVGWGTEILIQVKMKYGIPNTGHPKKKDDIDFAQRTRNKIGNRYS